MSAADVAVLVAAACSAVAAVCAVATCVVLTRRIRELRALVADLDEETVPMLRDARIAADQAATEMVRVGDVLASAEAVSTTVDSASRLAYRAFANPLVKVVAFFSGFGSAVRRLFARPTATARPRRRAARPGITAGPGRRTTKGAPAEGRRPIDVASRHRRGRRTLEARR